MADVEHAGGARFCSDCGRSLQPLPLPHVERSCEECQRAVYLVEPGEDGKGIKIRAGDKFTIPAGTISFSLDPSQSTGKLTRHGVRWYVTRVLFNEAVAADAAALESLLERYEKQADHVLENSDKLAHLDLEDEQDASGVWEILEKDKTSVEWWALLEGSMAHLVRDALEAGNAGEAVKWALHMQAARTMLIYKRSLEDHLWTGYRHTRNVYDIAAATASTSEEAELIAALRPAFEKLPEDVLHAWVEADVELGPKLKAKGIEERLLKALARYHLGQFERRRRDDALNEERKDTASKNRIQGAGVAAAVFTAVVGGLKAVGLL